MTPAAHMRVVLQAARERGLPFAEAWQLAIQTLPRPTTPTLRVERRAWLEELAWARGFYHCSYVGRPFADVDVLAEPVETLELAA